jgi:hypothetical protein
MKNQEGREEEKKRRRAQDKIISFNSCLSYVFKTVHCVPHNMGQLRGYVVNKKRRD